MFDITKPSFTMREDFFTSFKDRQPQWGPLGYFIYKRTYARKINNNVEEYWETLKRVTEGCFSIQKNHCKSHRLPWNEKKAQKSAQKMYELMWNFKFLPPGRGLWAMGTEQLLKNGGASLNNCAFISTGNLDQDPITPFCFLMDMSMLGVGVGFDILGADKVKICSPNKKISFQIPDSREGWVQALRLFLEAYLIPGSELPIFDYSLIRPAGSVIHGFGGTASGPEPLKDFFEYVEKNIFLPQYDKMLSSTDIVDLMNLIGKVVISGNARRSAEVALGKHDDINFITMKQNEDKLLHHRWASNNSIYATVGMDYTNLVSSTVKNGEPGYIWLENIQQYGRMLDGINWKDRLAIGCNPCLEQSLENGELCCLVETFPSRHDSIDEYKETLKYAYLYAKTVTLVPTTWEISNAVMLRNRRIGLSQSGIIKAFNKHGRRKMLNWCHEGYKFIDTLDIQYSNWFCIPKSIKKTSIKPSGTVSLLPGEPPGIHYPHSEYYIRRVRLGIHSEYLPILKKAGFVIEKAISQEDSTVVVEFPVKEDFFSRGKNDVSVWEQVANAVAYQKYWADNQVSITVTFKPSEKDDIENILEIYEDQLKAISFLPLNEHGYKQAPYEEITEEKYNDRISKLSSYSLANYTDADLESIKYCDSDKCEV